MKIEVYEKPEGRFAEPTHTAIYPWIEQGDSTIIDSEDYNAGAEMGYIAVYHYNGRIELNYGWEDAPEWEAADAEKLALALLKAVEISRQFAPVSN